MQVVFNNSLGDVDRRMIRVGFRTVELVEDAVGGEQSGRNTSGVDFVVLMPLVLVALVILVVMEVVVMGMVVL